MRQLVLESYTGQDNQIFTIVQKGPDYKIKCKKDKLFLTVDGPGDGERVYGSAKTLGDLQRFRIEETGDGSGLFAISTHFDKVFGLADKKGGEGTMIFQENKNGNTD